MPEAYAAVLAVPLTLRSSEGGVPEYETASLNVTVALTSRFSRYAPSGTPRPTPSTSGAMPSTLIDFAADSEPGDPAAGKARSAATPVAASTISPGPYRANLPS